MQDEHNGSQFKLEFYQKAFQRSISELQGRLQGSLTEFSIFKHDRNQHYGTKSDSDIAEFRPKWAHPHQELRRTVQTVSRTSTVADGFKDLVVNQI